MKYLIIGVAMLASLGPASCQIPVKDATVTIKVIGDDQVPIEGARVGAGFELPYWVNQPYRATPRIGITSSDGVIVFKERTSGRVTFGITKEGYYQTIGKTISFTSQTQKNVPFEAKATAVLKKKIDPIAMYARNVQEEIPQATGAVGFDLKIGDWVAPYGIGHTSDLLLTLKRQFTDRRNFRASVTITFLKKGDGVQAISLEDTDSGSELKLPRTAPTDGYEPKVVASVGASENGPGHESPSASNSFFLRVRTVLDDEGKVKSALYGKIDGGFRLDAINSKTCFVLFTYYLNPTSNDRNMEFDPQKNLFANLTSDEQVNAP